MADIARGHLFTGFPWNLPAHTWVNIDIMMATLPFIGLWGLNSLTIILFCLPVFIQNKITRTCYIILLIGLSFLSFPKDGSMSLPQNISLIQANIPQHEKWDPKFIWRNFDRYIEMSNQTILNQEPQIIIWPETAISQNFLNYKQPYQEFRNFLKSLPENSILITGYLNFKVDKAYNSLVVFNRDGDMIAQYDKHHLVPFGEYMPFGLDTITGFSNFQEGGAPELIRLDKQNINFLPLICYESIFPRHSKAATQGSIIIQITNDSWFGNTAGPYQHFDHARLRAIENRRPFIRLSGNGLSGVINENGHIQSLSQLNKKAIIQNNQ